MGWDQAVTAIVQALDAAGQMSFQYQQADKNRKFASSSHTREVADLKNAGLNPILSATSGGGASAASPASGASMGNLVSSALQTKLLGEQINQIKAETQKTTTEERLLSKNIPLADAQKGLLEKTLTPLVETSAKGLTDFGKVVSGTRKDAENLVVKGIEKSVSTAKSLKQKTNNIFNKVKKIFEW